MTVEIQCYLLVSTTHDPPFLTHRWTWRVLREATLSQVETLGLWSTSPQCTARLLEVPAAPEPLLGKEGRDSGRWVSCIRSPRNYGHTYLVIQPHVHHCHFSNHLDPAGATGVVRVDAPPEPHLDNQKEACSPGDLWRQR